jgi:glycosyltransferase involved in cell wall biosynthesis
VLPFTGNIMPDEQITTELESQSPRPPRVALVASRRIIVEYPLYLKYLLVGLADESVPVLLVCPPASEVDSIVPPAVEVVRHPVLDVPLLEHFNLNLLLNRLYAFQPELLHCLCETKAPMARWLARHLNTSYILNVNSIFTRFQYLSVSPTRCAAIVAPASSIADNFVAIHPKFADRVHQINAGVFVSDTIACFAHPERLPGIVVAHPLVNPGDLDNLFSAFHRLAIDNYQFMVVLIGSGPAEKNLRKKLRSLGLLRIVSIVPRLPGLDSALSAADVFIVPRPSAGYNSLLLSAMSAGSAVAGCKGGVDDLIIKGKTAIVFNPDDRLSIYNALKRLFDAREIARQIASGAQQYLRQNHHVSDMVASMLQLYRKVARHPEHQAESSAA